MLLVMLLVTYAGCSWRRMLSDGAVFPVLSDNASLLHDDASTLDVQLADLPRQSHNSLYLPSPQTLLVDFQLLLLRSQSIVTSVFAPWLNTNPDFRTDGRYLRLSTTNFNWQSTVSAVCQWVQKINWHELVKMAGEYHDGREWGQGRETETDSCPSWRQTASLNADVHWSAHT